MLPPVHSKRSLDLTNISSTLSSLPTSTASMTRPPRVLFERSQSSLLRRTNIFSHRPLYQAYRSFDYSRLINRNESSSDRRFPPKILAEKMKQSTKYKKKSFSMLREALKGAKMEIFEQSNLFKRLTVGFSLGFTIMKEILGTISMAPYGIRAFRTYQKLRSLSSNASGVRKHALEKEKKETLASSANQSPSSPEISEIGIIKGIKYGEHERNTLDIYLPLHTDSNQSHPVVVFVHGGVWASGEPWQYAPLAKRCAEEGVITVLVKYPLYPEVLAEDQAREVSDALSWTMRHIQNYHGDNQKIFLIGMSSGAHICAMSLWYRLKRRLLFPKSIADLLDLDPPYCFMGLSGVYNITEHYLYEQKRGVASISCMKPANGGLLNFPSMSPSLLFKALSIHVNKKNEKERGKGKGGEMSKNDKFSSEVASSSSSLPPPLMKDEIEMKGNGGGGIQGEGASSGMSFASVDATFHVKIDRNHAASLKSCSEKVQLNGECSKASLLREDAKEKIFRLANSDHGDLQENSAIENSNLYDDSSRRTLKEELITVNGKEELVDSVIINVDESMKENYNDELEKEKVLEGHIINARLSSSISPEIKISDIMEVDEKKKNDFRNENEDTTGDENNEDAKGAKYDLLLSLIDKNEWEKVHSIPPNLVCPSLIFCSTEDTVVPPLTGFEFVDSLTSLGVNAKILMYDGLEHADFVCWPSKSIEKKSKSYPLIQDILNVVSGKVKLEDLNWN